MKEVGYKGIMVDICPDCLKKKGFIVEFKEEDMEPALTQNKQTLEDKVYEILSDLGVVFEE